jgi:D-alanyl-D-alanine carboxypeptidase
MRHQLIGNAATQVMWTGIPQFGYVALGAWSFTAPLAGCGKAVALVERRGEIGGVQVRNLIAPALSSGLIVLSNTSMTEFGEIWEGKGLAHELASAAFCAPVAPTP